MKYRILFILLIIGIFLIYNSYSCIIIEFTSLPGLLSKAQNLKGAVVLNGFDICGTCPAGEFVISVKDDPDILFILPAGLSGHEIENFKYAFEVKGRVEKGDQEFFNYLDKIAACQKKYRVESNIFIKLDSEGDIKAIRNL
jgi:hypothetical protein